MVYMPHPPDGGQRGQEHEHGHGGPCDFAVFCVDGKAFDVRRRISSGGGFVLLRDVLDLIERQDGDERLLDWLRLRLRVLDVLDRAAKVEAGEAEPVVRKGSKKRPPARVQVSLLAPWPRPRSLLSRSRPNRWPRSRHL